MSRQLGDLRSDPVWTERYERARERITRVADEGLVGTYHVGSTAIEDLAGKPALDVIAVYEDQPALSRAATALAALDGHELGHDGEEQAVVARWDEAGERTEAAFLKLHLPGDEAVHNQLAVRDYLRDHPEARRLYEVVKREAAADHPRGGAEYTAAKEPLVAAMTTRAREAGYFDELPAAVLAADGSEG